MHYCLRHEEAHGVLVEPVLVWVSLEDVGELLVAEVAGEVDEVVESHHGVVHVFLFLVELLRVDLDQLVCAVAVLCYVHMIFDHFDLHDQTRVQRVEVRLVKPVAIAEQARDLLEVWGWEVLVSAGVDIGV